MARCSINVESMNKRDSALVSVSVSPFPSVSASLSLSLTSLLSLLLSSFPSVLVFFCLQSLSLPLTVSPFFSALNLSVSPLSLSLSLSFSLYISLSLLSVSFCLNGSLSLLLFLYLSLSLSFILSFTLCPSLCLSFLKTCGQASTHMPAPQALSLPSPSQHRAFDLCSPPYTLPSRLPQLLRSIWYEFLLRRELPGAGRRAGVGWRGGGLQQKTCSWSEGSGLGSGPGLPVRSRGAWWSPRSPADRGRAELGLPSPPPRWLDTCCPHFPRC